MNSVTISLLVVPAVVALLLFLVFTYLYEQTRQDYFRAWQLDGELTRFITSSMPGVRSAIPRLWFLFWPHCSWR